MKNVLICSLALLFAVSIVLCPSFIMLASSNIYDYHTFKRGDCFIRGVPKCERWEDCPDYIYKVLEVGKRKYRTVAVDMKTINRRVIGEDKLIMETNFFVPIACPVYLEGY